MSRALPIRNERAAALCSVLCLTLSATGSAQEPSVGIPSGGAESGHPVHVRLDAAATYGIGGQSYLGIDLKMNGYMPIWNTRLATGTIDGGLVLAYGNGPTWLAPWIDPAQVEGSTHHISLLLRIGHTFHMGSRRRASLGFHLFAGLHEWISSYSVLYANEGVSGSSTVKRSLLVSGGELDFAYRFSERVGLYLALSAPFPYQSSYAQTIFHAGAGLTFYLR